MADRKEPFAGILDESVRSWLEGKSIEDLTVVEDGGDTLFQESIARFDPAKKQLVDVPIFARLPGAKDNAAARTKAIAAVAELSKRDPTSLNADEAKAIVGDFAFEHLERCYLFEIILRRGSDPKLQYMLAEQLDRAHPERTLLELEARLSQIARLMDRRLKVADLEQSDVFWAIVHAVAKRRNLSPLAGTVGAATDAFIIYMATLLSDSRTNRSSES